MASQSIVDGGGVDIISKLPDQVLCRILAFLSTKESVSTSILSTRWRYLFAYVSNLDLDDKFLTPLEYPNRNTAIRKFLSFVDRLLLFHTSTTIKKLSLKIGVDCSHVYSWIAVAMLVVFDLDILGTVLNVLSDVCLPNLKTLRLKYVKFLNDDSVQRLFSSCPMLEEVLHILNCYLKNLSGLNISITSLKSLCIGYSIETRCSPLRLMINVPNVVYFKYVDFIAEDVSVAYMHSLVEADFNILLYDADIYEFGFAIADEELQVQVPAVNQFLQAIGHVKLLRLFMDYPGLVNCLSSFSLPLLSHKQFLPFVNLAYLETFDKCWLTPGTELFEFLESVLNLQTLQIHHLGQGFDANWSPPGKVPSCLLFYLKEIEIRGFKRDEYLFGMITYLLKNSRVLENLTIYVRWINQDLEEYKLRLTVEILTLPRNSEKCQVLIL
ncbi:hypothetical protein PTKIN_Ptkin11bG0171300 [Pterospermum kingtungense]